MLGTKRYKQELYKSGSVAEIRGIFGKIFGDA